MLISGIICSLILTGAQGALNPIEIKGAKFFDSKTGEQFFIKGVAYQPRTPEYYDVLAKTEYCKRDAKYLKEVGANMIRVYETYSEGDHDECMKIFEEAGIYVGIDLSTRKMAINRAEPSYSADLAEHFAKKIDVFSKYPNTIMFFAGNEVSNDKETTQASAFVKASLRDAKAHIKQQKRYIPIGYADNDDHDIRENVQAYFNCGSESERADFYGINIYSWCGKSTFSESGYDKLTKILSTYSTPVFLSESGCNTIRPRTFGEFDSLFSKDMEEVFSGGIAYEYSQEDNKYGLVDIKGGSVSPREDYKVLQKHFQSAKPTGVNKDSYNPKNTNKECPAISDTWKAHKNLPPPASKEACDCAVKALSCKLNKDGEKKENGEKVGKLVGNVCGNKLCKDIDADPEKGEYGAFSSCPNVAKVSIAFDAAVTAGSQCDFDSYGEKQSKSGSLDTCSKMVQDLKSKTDSGSSKNSKGSTLQVSPFFLLAIAGTLIILN